ncbi:MAG: hypothetical protein OYH76_01650 [Defluviicoccus sp.]|nr:hypothetical protein [Defluviicoccus sp.]MDE0274569.1 hypothetical protein [Defluviicoccus sp.]
MQDKFCRICWNTDGWESPTGTATDGPKSYYGIHGFGHEEWLFKYDWLIDGHRYGFLQPINKFFSSYSGQNCSILLYTLTPEGQILLIGEISDVYIPTIAELERVLTAYEDEGWLDRMRDDVLNIEGNTDVLENPPPHHIANVKFRPKDAKIFDPRPQVVGDHTITRNLRYHPFNWNDNYPAVAGD